jgi:hypothetical protein
MAYNPLKVLSDLFVKEQTELKKGLVVSGSISGSNTTGVYVKKDFIVDGDVEFGGVVTSAGYAQVGAFQVDGTFDVAGLTSLSGNVVITGSTSVDGQLYASSAIIDDLSIQSNLSIGAPNFVVMKQSDSVSNGIPSVSYVYTNSKLLISPSGSYSSGSSFLMDGIIDLNSIDSTVAVGTQVQDVAKTLKALDDYLHRLNQIIDF